MWWLGAPGLISCGSSASFSVCKELLATHINKPTKNRYTCFLKACSWIAALKSMFIQPTKPIIVTLTISCKIHYECSPTLPSQPSPTTAEDSWLQLPAHALHFWLCSGSIRSAMLHLVTGLMSVQEQWHSSFTQQQATLSAEGRGKESFRSNSLPCKSICTLNAVGLAMAGSYRVLCAEEHPCGVCCVPETCTALWSLKSFTWK